MCSSTVFEDEEWRGSLQLLSEVKLPNTGIREGEKKRVCVCREKGGGRRSEPRAESREQRAKRERERER